MATEIERKFLLKGDAWRNEKAMKYRQGYLNSVKERTVRVRTIGDKGYLTIKGISVGASRLEFEYEIPCQDANILLDICEKPLIEKTVIGWRKGVLFGKLTNSLGKTKD